MKIKSLLFLLLFAITGFSQQRLSTFTPGELWLDNTGKHINAHGGGILYYGNRYYWFGEFKSDTTNNAMVGVSCYSSNDLYNWKNEGIALSVVNDKKSDIVKGCIIERPKVVYNKKTKRFVMWFHLELKGKGYETARVGLAISDKVTGPFRYIRSFRSNTGLYPMNMPNKDEEFKKFRNSEWRTPEWKKAVEKGLFVKRDLSVGQMSRDMTLFVDENSKAYHIYSSEDNLTLQIAELSDDYLFYTGKYIRVSPGGDNEAPTLFKREGKYYMITSGCTGWAPNTARLFIADSIMGKWTQYPNPFCGENSQQTFKSQGTYILNVHGKKDTFIFMADRWTPTNPIDGRYIWLPISFEEDKPKIKWLNAWSLKNDSVTTLKNVKVSYTLSGKNLEALAEKILYKKTPQEDMYLYLLRPLSKTNKPLPAIVYFTGGGWVNGDVEGQIPNPAWFRDKGIIGIEADFRVKSRHGTSPMECIQDAKSAIRYVRAHAKELGIDPNRIIAAGGSAGGHIAACTFIDGGDTQGEDLKIRSRPNALVLHNPVLGEGFGKEFFDVHPEFSPILNVKKGWPPTIISNGTKDKTTPYEAAEKFTQLMKQAGNICELISVKGADHSCDWPVSNLNFLPDMNRMYDFLKEEKIIN